MKTSRITLHQIAATMTMLAFTLTSASCGKSVTPTETLPALAPVATDANAGSWKMIVLNGPTQIAVAPPVPVSDPTYQAELASIKNSQASLTLDQQAALTEWSGSGVLRWNQIMRELVARADLPPAPAPGGTYPVPDPNNPFADPQYPFGNPPYASRAYSYVAVPSTKP